MGILSQRVQRNAQGAVRGPVAEVQSLPAPVGGWNARDSFANMDPTDAITLENWFPTVSGVTLRGGSTNWATGLTDQVQTLMAYSAGATSKFFAVTSGGKIFDVTSQGAVGAPVVSGLSNGQWEYTNITTAGGSYLYCCNGTDKPLLYDGTTWVAIDSGSTPAISGVTTTTLVNIILFKHRIWFIQKNTLKAWYLPTDSVGGAAQVFDFSTVCREGGHLVDMDTWTVDGGYGMDDNLVFITSEGEVIVYRGTDPASIATWALAGIWKLGSPISRRAMLKWGGDLLVLTYDGLLPMAAALQSDRLDPRVALSDKIQGAITAATTAYGGNHEAVGWQVVYFAKANAVLINVPVAVGQQQQYVMNTITKSWCNITGWPANCFEIFNDDLYYGGNGVVVKAWDTSYSDNGTNIATNGIQAFNYFEKRGMIKYFTRARPSIFTDGEPAVFCGMNVDFNILDVTAPLTTTATVYGLWDSGKWDQPLWGSNLEITNTWLGITGLGYCGAVQLKTASSGLQIQWASTDIVFQSGYAGIS